jgi:L-fuconolactonase
MAVKIVDTHVHVWDFDQAEYSWLQGNTTLLNRTYNIEELEAERKAAGITSGVLVQAAWNLEDTEWMLHTARKTNWIAGVVAWLPLTDPAATQRLLEEKFLKEKYFKGVRHLIHDEPDATWLLQPTVLQSLELLAQHNIPYDVVGILPAHIETALKVAEKIPTLRMVFDHLNQPPISTKEKFGRWGELMRQAAQHPNFYMKISGLGTTCGNGDQWQAADILPYVEFALRHFGTDRCFCGGDWPVSLLAGSYTRTWNMYKEVLNQLTNESEQEKIYYQNAVQFYAL